MNKTFLGLLLFCFSCLAQNYGFTNRPMDPDTNGVLIYVRKSSKWDTLQTLYKADSVRDKRQYRLTTLSASNIKNKQPPQVLGSDALGHMYTYNINNLVSSGMVIGALGYTPITKTDISLTTTGSSGAATYNSATGAFNIPNYGGKRRETYSGTTNASGTYNVTFGTAYSVAPNIQANIVGGTNTNLIKITSVTSTSFTVTVVNRVDVVGLLPSYTNVNGAAVDVLISEK